jgi:hypothetical protein
MVKEVTARAGNETAKHEASSMMEKIVRFIALVSPANRLNIVQI